MSDMSAQVRRALDVAVAAIGGSAREGQIEMAEAVANALTDRHHLMVQAGTGTGKSLAYLIPGIVHGRKVLVATATLALQRQLVDRDLPAVVPALEKELGRDISYAIYKGVGNYVWLQNIANQKHRHLLPRIRDLMCCLPPTHVGLLRVHHHDHRIRPES